MIHIDPQLLSKYINNEVTAKERLKVERWMHENNIPESSLSKWLTPPQGVRIMLSLDPESDWLKVKEQLPGRQIFFSTLIKIAASVILATCIGFGIYHLKRGTQQAIAYKTVNNESDDARKITMDDGSFIYLNTGGEVTFPENFQENRSVTLKGEVYFDVKRDESNPFTIWTKGCQVKVLGTSFSVHSDSGFVQVIVKTGKVAFQSSSKNAMILEKNEKAFYNTFSKELKKQANSDPNAFSWQTHVLVFQNTALDKVASDLEKYFRIRISLINNNDTDLPKYTSRFENPSLKNVLEEMKLILPVDYSIAGNQVTIRVRAN